MPQCWHEAFQDNGVEFLAFTRRTCFQDLIVPYFSHQVYLTVRVHAM